MTGATSVDVRGACASSCAGSSCARARSSSVEGEDEFSFWHALVRDVAYQQIPRAAAGGKHRAAAMDRAHRRERVADHAEILAYHYGEAVDLARAAGAAQAELEEHLRHALLLAGDRACPARRRLRRAVLPAPVELAGDHPAERGAALAKLASILGLRGEADEAIAAYEEAIPVLRETDEVAAGVALCGLSNTAWARGDTSGRSPPRGMRSRC